MKTLANIVSNHVKNLSQEYSNKPKQLLINMPAIMELYNFVHSDPFMIKGKQYPSDNSIKIAKEILSLLPSNLTISDEEKEFMDRNSVWYVDKKMPKVIFDRYSGIYCKMLLNKITRDDSEEESLLQYSDVLLGQLARETIWDDRNKKMLARLVLYDYTKDKLNSTIISSKQRVTFSEEFDDETYRGQYSESKNLVSILTSFSTMEEFLACLVTINHEIKHATDCDDRKSLIYKSVEGYLISKLSILREKHSSLFIDKGKNYFERVEEICARIEGLNETIAFIKKHGLTETASTILEKLEYRKMNDTLLLTEEEYIPNIAIRQIGEELRKPFSNVNRMAIEGRYFDSDYRNKIFDRTKYREYRSSHAPKYSQKIGNLAKYKSFVLEGRKWNINKKVHSILLKEPETINKNKFLEIEYNSDGKRKTFAQMLEEMSRLDESPENNGKRAIYGYILSDEKSKIDEPRQAFEALFSYKSTNLQNDTIVMHVTQKQLIRIVDKMIEQLYSESIHDISNQYLQNGYDGHLYGRTYGNSYYERASSMIDAVIMRCYNETKEIENGDRKEYTPFVEGILTNVYTMSKKRGGHEKTTVLNQLKKQQKKYDKNANAGVVREALDGYIVSISDIVKITYGPLFDKMQDSGKRVGSFFQFRES